MMTDHSTAMPRGARVSADALDQAVTLLLRVRSLNELLYMAGEGMVNSKSGNAITTGCDTIDQLLAEVIGLLESKMEGAAS